MVLNENYKNEDNGEITSSLDQSEIFGQLPKMSKKDACQRNLNDKTNELNQFVFWCLP